MNAVLTQTIGLLYSFSKPRSYLYRTMVAGARFPSRFGLSLYGPNHEPWQERFAAVKSSRAISRGIDLTSSGFVPLASHART